MKCRRRPTYLCGSRPGLRRAGTAIAFGERGAPRGNPGGERDAGGGEVDQRLALGGGLAGRSRVP